LVVNDDDLLVMGGERGMFMIENEANPVAGLGSEFHTGQALTLKEVNEGEVPAENVNVQFRPHAYEMIEKIEEPDASTFDRRFVKRTIIAFRNGKLRATICVPPYDEDLFLGSKERLRGRAKESIGIDAEARTLTRIDPFGVAANLENSLCDFHRCPRRFCQPP
jgi:hypothetical protein